MIDDILADPEQLFELKERLAKLTVLGPWIETHRGWERPEAGHPEGRIIVWESCEGSSDLEPGWYYRIGFCVLCILGVSSRNPGPTAEACMAVVDELLAGEKSIVITRGASEAPTETPEGNDDAS